MSTYYKKYLKYKNKYLELRSQIGGVPEAASQQPSMSQYASQSQAPPRPPSMSQAPPQQPSASQSQAPPQQSSAPQSQAPPRPPSMSQAPSQAPPQAPPQESSDNQSVVKNNCNKFKIGSYVKQISIDSRYMKYSIDNTPKNPGESDAEHLARVKNNQKLFLEEFELGIITEILKCGLQWKENYYKVKLPNYHIPIHLYENEIIPITEKEYNTILSAKKSKVKAFNHDLTEKILKQRLTVLMEL